MYKYRHPLFEMLDIIYFYAARNASLNNRTSISEHDILIAFKRYKYGYEDFRIPSVVKSVYESIFAKKRLPVFIELTKTI